MFTTEEPVYLSPLEQATQLSQDAYDEIEAFKAEQSGSALRLYRYECSFYSLFPDLQKAADRDYSQVEAAFALFRIETDLDNALENFYKDDDFEALSAAIDQIKTESTKILTSYYSQYIETATKRLADRKRLEKQKELITAALLGAASQIPDLLKAGADPNLALALSPPPTAPYPVDCAILNLHRAMADSNPALALSPRPARYPLDCAILNLQVDAVAKLIELGATLYSENALSQAELKATTFYGSRPRDSLTLKKAMEDKDRIAAMLGPLTPVKTA